MFIFAKVEADSKHGRMPRSCQGFIQGCIFFCLGGGGRRIIVIGWFRKKYDNLLVEKTVNIRGKRG